MWKLITTTEDKIKDEKPNKEAAKVSALSSGEVDKYEYLTSKKKCCLLITVK